MNEKLIEALNGHKQTLKSIYDILESVDQKNPMEGKFQEIFDVVVASAKHIETALAQAQQPVAPIGVELVEAEKMIDFEIRSHLGVPMDSIDVMVRRNLATAILEKLLALPQTEKGDLEQVGWYDPDEPSKVWNMDNHDDDLSEFHSPLYAIRSEVRGPEFCGRMVEGQCLCTIPCSIFKTPQDAGKVKP